MKKFLLEISFLICIIFLTSCAKNNNITETLTTTLNESETESTTQLSPTAVDNTIKEPTAYNNETTNDKNIDINYNIVHDIILDYNKDMYSKGQVSACGYKFYDYDIKNDYIKLYGFVSYGEYSLNNNQLEQISGGGPTPTIIEYNKKDIEDYNYDEILTENNFEDDVRSMFKDTVVDKILNRNEEDMKLINKMEIDEATEKLNNLK